MPISAHHAFAPTFLPIYLERWSLARHALLLMVPSDRLSAFTLFMRSISVSRVTTQPPPLGRIWPEVGLLLPSHLRMMSAMSVPLSEYANMIFRLTQVPLVFTYLNTLIFVSKLIGHNCTCPRVCFTRCAASHLRSANGRVFRFGNSSYD